jgi:hypothetical protein
LVARRTNKKINLLKYSGHYIAPFVKEFGCEKDSNPSKHQNKNLAKNTSAEFQKNLKGELKEEEFASNGACGNFSKN